MGKSNGNGYDHDWPSVQSGGASVIQVETLGKPGIFVLFFAAFIAAIAIFAAGWSIYEASILEREVRVYQDELMRFRARLDSQGIATSDEDH